MSKKKLKNLVEFFDKLVREERLDPRTRGQIAKAIKELSHGLATKNLKQVNKAIDRLAETLSKI